jgi:hypothetical protein
LLLDLGRLRGGLDVILHLILERRLRIGRQPEPPQRVLDEISDDPLRCEPLGGRRDIGAGDHLPDDLLVPLGDVRLVANRERIANPTGCLFRHHIAALSVRGNRQQPRG